MSAPPAIGADADTSAATRRGIAAMLVSQACFVCGDALVKLATADLPTGEIIVVRGIFASLIVAAMMFCAGEMGAARLALRPLVLLRAGIEAAIIAAFISGLRHMPLPDATAITLASPFITAVLLVVIFKERLGWRRWSAIALGFAGVLLVVKPGAQGISPVASLFLLVAALVAVRDLLTAMIPASVPSLIITLATTEAAVIGGLGLGAAETWHMPAGFALLLLAGAALATTLGNLSVVNAFRGTDAAAVAPFRYTMVVFALILGYSVWGDVPDTLALSGMALVVGSGVFIIHRGRVRARQAQA